MSAGVVTYMNGSQLQSAIQAANQAVSGMTLAEAAVALGGTAQAQTGGAQITAFPIPYQQYGQVTTEAMYASQLWQYWQTAGAAAGTTALGAAASAAVSWAQGALIGTGTGLAATAGLLTLSVPTAVAMAAPLLGVGLGYALYDTNPQLWNNIAEGLVDFTTDATQTISALIDETGHVLLDSAFVQKLKQIFEDNDVPLYNEADPSPIIIPSDNPYGLPSYTVASSFSASLSPSGRGMNPITVNDKGFIRDKTMYAASASSDMSFEAVYYLRNAYNATYRGAILNVTSYTLDNKTVYYGIVPNNFNYEQVIDATALPSDSSLGLAAWVAVYGGYEPSIDYPIGTSGWKNSQFDGGQGLDNIPTYPVYDPATETTRPYYPVTPYIGDNPGTSVDPTTTPQPDPTSPIPEWEPIVPYIPPVVNPEIQIPQVEEFPQPRPEELTNPGIEEDPVHDPIPEPDPEKDPAEDPLPAPVPIPDPPTPDPPQNTGLGPDIIFPPPYIPDLPEFPSIVPQGSSTPLEPGVSGSAGFIQVYNPTPAEFIAFGRWLWVTYAQATQETIWNNPFDGVIGAHELYATPSKDGYSTIRSGFLDSGIGSIIVRQRYTQINCGSIIIPEYWGNYLDYSPYSQAYIYLPFIGIVPVDVDDIVGSAVNILYHVDSYTGSCIAQITAARDNYSNTLYQFSGDCSVEIPMAGGSQAAIKAANISANAYQNAANISAGASLYGGLASGIVSGLGGLVGLNPVGGITSGINQAISGYANSISQKAYGEAQHTAAMVSQKSTVQHSGAFGASHGAMGIKKPYIFIRRPIQKVVYNYNKLYGYPAHKRVIIGNCTGYLRCREVNVVSPLATDEEKSMIEQALKSGVYVTE